MTTSLIAFAILLALCFLRVPIAFAMVTIGFGGFAMMRGFDAAFSQLAQTTFATGITYELSVVPLFVLMGNFITSARLSEDLYSAANAFLGHRKGGLAMATVVACGGFASVCGSSLATAATMAKVAMPSMRKFGYADSLAAGSIAAGGTLGILIPPSVLMVIYGILTESDIGQLFVAGVLPGVLAVFLYTMAVQWVVQRRPEMGPPGERTSWRQRWRLLLGVWGVVLLFLLIMVGIYGGIFTPTEAAGIGAAGAFLFSLYRRQLTWTRLYRVLLESAATTAMLFMVLIGAYLFSDFLAQAGFADKLRDFLAGLDIGPWGILVAMLMVYLLLGCVLESLSMVVLTVPVFVPLVASLGFDQVLGVDQKTVLIWFGILLVVMVEISLLTPPVGLNVFVLRSVMPDVPTGTIFRGVVPFYALDIVRISLLVAFPVISLALPSTMPDIRRFFAQVGQWIAALF
jgi:C4-dicarboxylate transporter DctM subunit